ncbi:helix-turn-helix domain-containing protein [Brevibacillus sp. NPDC003359]|uniref:helix-turn-helix domain-containing protein n=1 Tax=unclassified Brevibacillus TaxID=2684853 RepID=UPI0036BAA2AE
MNIGIRIRDIRKSKKMTQDELAQGICSRKYISSIENGLITPSKAMLEKILEKLQVSPDFLSPIHTFSSEELTRRISKLIDLLDEKRIEEAESLLTQLSSIPKSFGHEAIIYWAMGKLAELRRDFNKAEEYYSQAETVSKDIADISTRVRILDSIGTFYCRFRDDVPKGSFLLNDAFELLRKYDLSGRLKINVLISLGNLSLRLSEYVSAIRLFKEVYSTQEAYNTQYRLEDTFMGLGIGYAASSHHEEAEYYNQKAIDIYESKGNDEILYMGCIGNMGIFYRMIGRYDASLEYLKRAQDGYKSLGFAIGHENNSIELALTYKAMGNFEHAKQLLQSVADNGQDSASSEAKSVLTELLLEENKVEEAFQLFIDVFDTIANLPPNRPLFHTYHKIANMLMEQGEHHKAAIMFKRISTMLVR